jgi:methylthioribose-1-phosphate isomerase
MLVDGKYYQSIWFDESDPAIVRVIDQKKLPFFFEIRELHSVDDIYNAIKDMTVRGAPLIGAAAAFGIYLATLEINSATNTRLHLENAARYLVSCRPTAVNLSWAVKYVIDKVNTDIPGKSISDKALQGALEICENEKENCRQLGKHGLSVIKTISEKKGGETVNILTHCNAGWLACIDFGTVTSPLFLAHEAGIPVHVWVDETRPRNQGARLTAWELRQAGIPYTLIADNTGGHLMQHKMVDIVLIGSDRTTSTGDVANKIGTYLKALAAFDNKIPFYSAFTSSTFDPVLKDGIAEIPVEERDQDEVAIVEGLYGSEIVQVKICPDNTKTANFAFDVTPAKYITGLITERGICKPSEKEIKEMFSDKFI